MKKLAFTLTIAATLFAASNARAVVSVAHVENSTVGSFLSSAGDPLTSGAVSIGFFSTNIPDSAFGTTIVDWNTLRLAGYIDVRETIGATLASGFDWDQPGIGGTVQNIPFAAAGQTPSTSQLPQGTQLYIVGFNNGTFANNFSGATEWSVLKDGVGPANGSPRLSNLNAITGILIGTDNSASNSDVNMTSLVVGVPEPSRFMLLGLGVMGLVLRRRRK